MEISSSPVSALFPSVSAETLFGSGAAGSILSAGQSASGISNQQSAATIITSQKREINRIRGYKLDLTPADLQKLSKLKEKIQVIEAKAAAGTVRVDELVVQPRRMSPVQSGVPSRKGESIQRNSLVVGADIEDRNV